MTMRIQSGLMGFVVLASACTSNPSFLFPRPIEGVPGVQHLGTIEPIDPFDADVGNSTIYGEIGPTGSAATAGVTFEFEGTNDTVCVWVDPEAVYWNQSVARAGRSPSFREPDNIFDDGDLDLYGGQSVFYTGTPGTKIGTFEVRNRDALGNTVPVDFVECRSQGGRAGPEACEFRQTLLGVRYTVVLESWSTPLDDDRLGYGLLVSNGPCADLVLAAGEPSALGPEGPNNVVQVSNPTAECVIRGEVVRPGSVQGERALNRGLPSPTWFGLDEVIPWDGALDFEEAFCRTEDEVPTLARFCRDERARVLAEDATCSWQLDASIPENGERCYCGDPLNTPRGGVD